MSKKKKGGKLPKFVVGEGNLYGEKPTIEYDHVNDVQTIFVTGDPKLIKKLRKAFKKSGAFSSIMRTANFSLTLKMDAKTTSQMFVYYAVKAYVYLISQWEQVIKIYEIDGSIVPGELVEFYPKMPNEELLAIREALMFILKHQRCSLAA
jgi:hypothetical protein